MSTFQFIFLLFEFVVVLGVLIYLHAITISLFRGMPYVSTKYSIIRSILDIANLKQGMQFLELGCGDGRVVCEAVHKYGVVGRGVDISRLWLVLARLRAQKMGIDNKVEFLHQNIKDTDLTWPHVIYIYGMPKFLSNLKTELRIAVESGKTIISHEFSLDDLKLYQYAVNKEPVCIN
jgi:SAM-dependent methyltransferase